MAKSTVFFSRDVSSETVIMLYEKLGIELPGKVAVKVHTGEKGNQNFMRPEFWKPMFDRLDGRIVECNTAYGDRFAGIRDHTASHRKLIEYHGWTKYYDVDIMDEEGPDVVWEIPNGKMKVTRLINISNQTKILYKYDCGIWF